MKLAILLLLLIALPLHAQIPSVRHFQRSTMDLQMRSVPQVTGTTPTELGAVYTVPTTWYYTDTIGSTEKVHGGATCVSLRHLGDTTAVLYLENVGSTLATFLLIADDELSVLLPGESRSLSMSTTSVGYKVKSGYGSPAVAGDGISESIVGIEGRPLEIKAWR